MKKKQNQKSLAIQKEQILSLNESKATQGGGSWILITTLVVTTVFTKP